MCSGRFNSQIATTTITNATAKFVLGDISYRRIDNSTALEVEVTSNPNSGKRYFGDVVIPSTVTHGDNTYTVTRIGVEAFYQCSELTNVSLPSTVTSIGKYAFYAANKLKKIEFKGSNISLDYGAFEECSQLKDVIFRGQLTKLDAHSFYRCRSLESITLPSGLTSIENSTFDENTNLKNISIPEGVTYLGQYAFYGCSSLTTIQLPSTLEKIDHHAFQNSGLQSIVVPDNVTYMGEEVFHDCYSLNSVTLPAKLETLDNQAFFSCRGLRSISIPEGFKILNYRTFYGCNALTTVQLPSTLTTINGRAFEGCSALRTITLPESVNNIGSYAFSGCSALESVYALPTTPPTVTNEFAFADQINTATLYVKSSTLNDYKSNVNWCQFNTIQSVDQVPTAQPTFSFDVTNYKLSILSQDANAAIYYTRDNSEPTEQSIRYMEPIDFMQNDTIKAIAISEGLAQSVVSEFRKSDFTVPVPVCSMDENFVVTITCETPQVEGFPQTRIYYLINTSYYDVSLTDTNWQLYDGEPIQLTQPKYVHVYAQRDGWITSSQTYFNFYDSYYTRRPDMYWHADKLKLELYNYDADATVYYTIDGSDPTEQSMVYNAEDSIAISRNVLVKCIAMRPGHFNSMINQYQVTGVNQTFSKDGIYYRIVDNSLADEVEVTHGDKKYEGDIIIPESIKYAGVDYEVTRIGEYAFAENNWGYSKVTSVTIPSSVRTIGYSAFDYADKLTEIDVPASVTTLERAAFYCTGLKKVILHEGLETMGIRAFYGNGQLTDIKLPQTLKSIGFEAFYNCDQLTKLYIPDNVTTIGYSTFAECDKLESVTLPSGLTELEDNLFYNTPLKSIVIPAGVTTIGKRVFYQCSSLHSATIPASVQTIGNEAFRYCSSLTSISIPEGLTTIGEYTFDNCKWLTTVHLPSSLTTIGRYAFQNCSSMPTLTLPENLNTIDTYAFNGCSAMTSVYSLAATPPTLNGDANTNAFANVLGNATLFVKTDAKEKYDNATIWSSFSKKESFEDVPCAQPTFALNNYRLSIATATNGATIYYTTDGTEPTTASTPYTAPFNFWQNGIVKAIAVKDGMGQSLVAEFKKEDLTVAIPVATMDEQFKVTITCEQPDIEGFPQTRIYYLLNESYYNVDLGDSNWQPYDGEPIQMTQPKYVHVYAERDGWITSSQKYTDFYNPYYTRRPEMYWHANKQKLRLYNYDSDATVYYTIDGSNPTEQSMVYNAEDSIAISRNVLVKCIAMRPGHFNSTINQYQVTGVNQTFSKDGIYYRIVDNSLANAPCLRTCTSIDNQGFGFNR